MELFCWTGVFEAIFHWVFILPPLSAFSFSLEWYYRTKDPYSSSDLTRNSKPLAKFWIFFLWDFWVCGRWSADEQLGSDYLSDEIQPFPFEVSETGWWMQWLKNLVPEISVLFWILRHLVMVRFLSSQNGVIHLSTDWEEQGVFLITENRESVAFENISNLFSLGPVTFSTFVNWPFRRMQEAGAG